MRFVETVKQALLSRGIESQTAASREWLRVNMRKANESKGAKIAKLVENDYKNYKIAPKKIGEMFAFVYDPKHKTTLPYYDTFPLIFIVDFDSEGFLGLNLHYLSPMMRARLYELLLRYRTDNRYDAKTRLEFTWRILKAFSGRKMIRPIVKRYLWSHVKSRLVRIPSEEWEITLFLPTERFVKESKRSVWSKSRNMTK